MQFALAVVSSGCYEDDADAGETMDMTGELNLHSSTLKHSVMCLTIGLREVNMLETFSCQSSLHSTCAAGCLSDVVVLRRSSALQQWDIISAACEGVEMPMQVKEATIFWATRSRLQTSSSKQATWHWYVSIVSHSLPCSIAL